MNDSIVKYVEKNNKNNTFYKVLRMEKENKHFKKVNKRLRDKIKEDRYESNRF